MNTLGLVETIAQDLRYGARLLRRNPLFAAVAILTLALGAGANTAIFQLVNAVRLRPLPVEDAHELVEVAIDTHGKGRTGRFISQRSRLSHPLYERIRQDQQVFSGLAAWGSTRFDLSDSGESRPVQGMWVNGEFFTTLGVKAQAGRLFTAADDVRGCAAPAVVLSSGFWRREYRFQSACNRPDPPAGRLPVRDRRRDTGFVLRRRRRPRVRRRRSALRRTPQPRPADRSRQTGHLVPRRARPPEARRVR